MSKALWILVGLLGALVLVLLITVGITPRVLSTQVNASPTPSQLFCRCKCKSDFNTFRDVCRVRKIPDGNTGQCRNPYWYFGPQTGSPDSIDCDIYNGIACQGWDLDARNKNYLQDGTIDSDYCTLYAS